MIYTMRRFTEMSKAKPQESQSQNSAQNSNPRNQPKKPIWTTKLLKDTQRTRRRCEDTKNTDSTRRSNDDRPSETEHTHSSAIQDPHTKLRPQNSEDTKNLWRAGGAKTPKDSPRHGTRHCADKPPTDGTKHTHSVLHASLA